MNKKRDRFGTRLGFLLVSAGCAIGLGNIWKFPYITGKFGGGAFVVLYLIFLLILGIPVLTIELALGRGSQKTIIEGYKKLEKPGSKWHIHGWFCLAGCYLLMMFYAPVAGWMVDYFWKFLTGGFSEVSGLVAAGTDAAAVQAGVEGVFGGMLGDPLEMILFGGIVVAGSFLVCMAGLQKGVERVTKYMMIGLFSLILILIVRSFMLPGAGEGLKFYLLPDFGKAAEAGLSTVASAAMNQAFFTLSIGIASMEIFGSYMNHDKAILGEAVRITVLDTVVAMSAGLIIFPAVFTYGLDAGSGPALIFLTLPQIFVNMAGGRLWGTLFFLFMSFAALSTVIAVFENLIAAWIDSFGVSRKKATIWNLVLMLVLTLPCIFGFNIWKDATATYTNTAGELVTLDIQGIEDFIVSNILLPGGGILYTVFSGFHFGWGFDKFRNEANQGEGLKVPEWMRYIIVFVLPLLILLILVQGLMRPVNVIAGIVLSVGIAVLEIYEAVWLVRQKKAE